VRRVRWVTAAAASAVAGSVGGYAVGLVSADGAGLGVGAGLVLAIFSLREP
jgi:hypothetical protein